MMPKAGPSQLGTKKSKAGARLFDRLADLQNNFDDTLINKLINGGFKDAALLPLIGTTSNPTGEDVGETYTSAGQAADLCLQKIRALISLSALASADRQALFRAIDAFGAAKGTVGHLGAQFEMLAADHLHNIKRAELVAQKSKENDLASARRTLIADFIRQHELQEQKATPILAYGVGKLKKYLAEHKTLVADDYLTKQLRLVLKTISKTDRSKAKADQSNG